MPAMAFATQNLITQAVKREPNYIFGKPFKSTVDYIIKKYKVKKR